MIYNTCSECGATLDHGEKCDCKKALITVKQIPIIETRLKEIREDILIKVNEVKGLTVTAENKQIAKQKRTELTKEFENLEELRKQVKAVVLEPYNAFEKLYKDIITVQFTEADKELKQKIADIEKVEIDVKKADVTAYYLEYAESLKIDFVPFEKMGLKINLTESLKKLKDQSKAFLDRINSDLELIDTQERKDEILLEYKANLNCSLAITTVANRHKALEEIKVKQQEALQEKIVEQVAVGKVEKAIPTGTLETLAPPKTEEPILTLAFKVKATKEKLIALKQFLNDGGYTYE